MTHKNVTFCGAYRPDQDLLPSSVVDYLMAGESHMTEFKSFSVTTPVYGADHRPLQFSLHLRLENWKPQVSQQAQSHNQFRKLPFQFTKSNAANFAKMVDDNLALWEQSYDKQAPAAAVAADLKKNHPTAWIQMSDKATCGMGGSKSRPIPYWLGPPTSALRQQL